MKKKLRKLITVMLTVAILVTSVVPVYANDTQYLSELMIVYADDLDGAKSKLEGINKKVPEGEVKWKLIETNLNEGVDVVTDAQHVYMAYKTTTKEEEAITDIAVMDMYGGYDTGNYEQQLKDSWNEYMSYVKHYKDVADLFAQKYKDGETMAISAYRQLNLYMDDDTGLKMGDFFLNIPSDEALTTILMQSNDYIMENIRTILAIGVSDTDSDAYLEKVSAFAPTAGDYEYEDEIQLYEDALILDECLSMLSVEFIKYEAIKDELKYETEKMTNEEFMNFELAHLYEMFENTEYIDGYNLAEFVVENDWVYEDLYPMLETMNAGQRALSRLGQFRNIVLYSTTEKTAEEIDKLITDNEEAYSKSISVYSGQDRSIYNGTYAFTNQALREMNDGSDSWKDILKNDSAVHSMKVWGCCTAVNLLVCGTVYGYSTAMANTLTASMDHAHMNSLQYELDFFNDDPLLDDTFDDNKNFVEMEEWNKYFNENSVVRDKFVAWAGTALRVFLIVQSIMTAIEVGCIVYAYYHPEYLDIPEILIDIKRNQYGDKYVKYEAVCDTEGNAGDLNGWYGKQWNALYYTKDSSAGSMLVDTYSCEYGNSAIRDNFIAVHYFGQTDAFDLNSHQYNNDVNGIYLSFQKGKEKTAIEDSLPDVVGSVVKEGDGKLGYYLFSGGTGLVLGMCSMIAVQKVRGKKDATKA